MDKFKKIIEKTELLGWNVKEDGHYYLLSKKSPIGINVTIEFKKTKSMRKFIENVFDAYKNYDVSSETMNWIDGTGHGINGAPHELEGVLNEIKWCKNVLSKLWYELEEMEYEVKSKE